MSDDELSEQEVQDALWENVEKGTLAKMRTKPDATYLDSRLVVIRCPKCKHLINN